METKPRKAPAHLYDPLFALRHRILNLLETMDSEYLELAHNGTPLAHRLALAKYSAEATGILTVMQACEAHPQKELMA